jgi:hypothetical protein
MALTHGALLALFLWPLRQRAAPAAEERESFDVAAILPPQSAPC